MSATAILAKSQAGAPSTAEDPVLALCGGRFISVYGGCGDEGIRIIDVRYARAALLAF